jgi:hypothetical protein
MEPKRFLRHLQQPVQLDSAKTNEEGMTVHENAISRPSPSKQARSRESNIPRFQLAFFEPSTT